MCLPEGGGEQGSEVGVFQVQEKVGQRAPAGRGLVSGAGMRPHTLHFSPCLAKGGRGRAPLSPTPSSPPPPPPPPVPGIIRLLAPEASEIQTFKGTASSLKVHLCAWAFHSPAATSPHPSSPPPCSHLIDLSPQPQTEDPQARGRVHLGRG